MFSDSTLCVGVSNPSPSNNWATTLDEIWNEHGFDDKLNLAAREVQFMWHAHPSAHPLDIKKHIQTHLNGLNPESFEDRIIILSMFNDTDWTQKGKERQHRNLFVHCQRSGSICETIQVRTLVLHGACVREDVVERKSGQWESEKSQMVDLIKCRTSPQIFPATASLSLGQCRKGGRNYHFQGTCENKKIPIKTTLAGNLLCIHNSICQRYDTENLVLTPRGLEK